MSIARSRGVAFAAVALLILALALGIRLSPRSGSPEAGAMGSPAQVRLPAIAPADEPARLAAVRRYLRASEYMSNLKASMQQMIKTIAQQMPASSPALVDPLQSVDVGTLEDVAAPLFARRLTLVQAQEIAAFYESESGRAIVQLTRQGTKAPPDEQAASRHEAAIQKFFKSEAGRSLMAMTSDPELSRAVMQAATVKTGAAP